MNGKTMKFVSENFWCKEESMYYHQCISVCGEELFLRVLVLTVTYGEETWGIRVQKRYKLKVTS